MPESKSQSKVRTRGLIWVVALLLLVAGAVLVGNLPIRDWLWRYELSTGSFAKWEMTGPGTRRQCTHSAIGYLWKRWDWLPDPDGAGEKLLTVTTYYDSNDRIVKQTLSEAPDGFSSPTIREAPPWLTQDEIESIHGFSPTTYDCRCIE